MLTLILFFTLYCYTIEQSSKYQIGFMINEESLRYTIDKKIRDFNGDPADIGVSKDVRLNESIYMLSNDAMTATSDICDYLISNQVYLVITTNPTNSMKSPSIVSYACAFYHIPVIAVQARESEYSDKHIHPTTLRMVPPYSDQARVLSILIKHFKLNKINIIATNDYDGRMTYIKFTTWAYKFGIAIENSVLIPPGVSDVKSYLNQLNSTQSKVMVLISRNNYLTCIMEYHKCNITLEVIVALRENFRLAQLSVRGRRSAIKEVEEIQQIEKFAKKYKSKKKSRKISISDQELVRIFQASIRGRRKSFVIPPY